MSSSSTGKVREKKVLFSSSSDDDDDGLSRELAMAAERERRRNPHAEEGRARLPRAHPLQSRKVLPTDGNATSTKKLNLFDDDDDGNSPSKHAEARKERTKRTTEVDTPAHAEKKIKNCKDSEADGLRINKQYAAKFEEVKRKQELHKLTEKYGKRLGNALDSGADDDDEEGDEEDDDAVMLTRENELAFARALLAVRKASAVAATAKVTNVQQEEYLAKRYFPSADEQVARNTEVFESAMAAKREAKKQRFTLADEYRRGVQSTAAAGSDGGGGETPATESSGLRKLKPQTAEERKLREAFLKSAADSTSDFSVARKENAVTGGLRGGDAEEKEEARRLMEEAFAIGGGSKVRNSSALPAKKRADDNGSSSDGEDGAGVGDNDGDEVFIKDYFTRELWRAESHEGGGNDDDREQAGGGGHYAALAKLAQEEEDEAFYNDAEVWEREFQEKKYRHEEAEEAERVRTFARPIGDAAEGLLRKQNTSRREARLRRVERAEELRQQQLEELKRLKHLKRQEIDSQRALIAAVAGLSKHGDATKPSFENEEDELAKLKAVWSEKDLEADFDPVEFDKKMALLFDEEYYDDKNVDENEIAYFDAEMDVVHDPDAAEGEEDDDNDDDDDSDDDDKHEETAEGHQGASYGRKLRMAAVAALEEEPDLFKAQSLEAARQQQQQGAAQSKREKKSTALADAIFSSDALPSASPAAASSSLLASDPVALLYPSASLQYLEEASFQKRREIEELLASASPPHGSSSHTAAPDEGANNAETLQRLKEDLRQKEEEYYQLHHDGTLAGGEIKSRFRYREVPAEDFTLSIEDILARDDRQLNMIAPMDCYAAYLDKAHNVRDRHRIERRRVKGFRELDTDRHSRRYGDLKRTVILDPSMSAEDGEKIVANLRKRLREEGTGEAGIGAPRERDCRGPGRGRGGGGRGGVGRGQGHSFGGRGRGQGHAFSNRGRGRGGPSGVWGRGGRGGGRGRG